MANRDIFYPLAVQLNENGTGVPFALKSFEKTTTDAVANKSETFTGNLIQFITPSVNTGFALRYDFESTAATNDVNLVIRLNSHTDPTPIFDYQRANGHLFNIASGVNQLWLFDLLPGETESEIGLYFRQEDVLYVTVESQNNLSLRGQTIAIPSFGDQTIPSIDVYGRLATNELLATRDWVTGQITNPGNINASNVTQSDSNQNGILVGATNQQQVNDRIDATGLGASPREFNGSFTSTWGTQGNQAIWYGNRQTVYLIGQSPTSGIINRNNVFELPDITELNLMFNDLVSRGLGEIFTITIEFRGGTSNSVVRNSLTVRPPSVSALFDRNELPVTIGRGAFVTFRITRTGSSIGQWERITVGQSQDPVATFGEVVLQNIGWNNSDSSFLPNSSIVQKGYAFPVIGSNPNDGTLRQGLLDSGVSDRVIYDGDYVVWTADTFTSWADGDNWFVINRDSLQRMTREQSNFLSQTSEIDNRADIAPVSALTTDALVWLSENPLSEAPFLTPSSDSNNPRSGDNYPYVGGRENRNAMNQFTLGSNRFNNYITIGITPSFITGHNLRDIEIRIYDTDRTLINTFNLQDDFTFVDDVTFTNSTVRHYQRNTSVNYPFLATIEIWLTTSSKTL